jgi:hypothetical protein
MESKINLKIQVKNSILDGKILIENINIDNLNKLLNSSEDDDFLKSYDKVSRSDLYENEFLKKKYCTEKEQLKKYAENIKYGSVFVRYDKVRKLNGYGRVFPSQSLGLFSFRKQIRGALAYEKYVDIDIVNCHPVLLLQIVQSNNIECKYLKEYVNNRDKYLNLVMSYYEVSRDKAKELFIILLYFGSFSRWAEDNNITKNIIPEIKNLKIELRNIGNIMISHNDELVETIKNKMLITKNKKSKNIIGTTMSFILQEWEAQILETLFIYCTEKKIIVNDCVLCADGLMLNSKKYNPSLLIEFNQLIKSKFGFDLEFVKKELNTDLLNKLNIN